MYLSVYITTNDLGCNAIRVVTYMLNGYAIHCEHQMKKQNTLSAASLLEMPQLRNIIYHVLLEITQSALYVFKEAYLYESILLLLNEGLYRSPLLELISTDKTLIECILLCYIYLLGFQSSSNPSAMSDRDIHLSCGVGTTTTTGASSSVIHAATMKSLLQFCRLVYDNSNTNVTPANANAMPVALSDDKMIEVVMGPYYGFLLASIMCDTHIMELSINSIGTKANSKANPGSRPTHPDVIFNSENYFGSKQLPVLSASEQQSLLNEYLVNFMTAPKEYSENVPVSMNTKKAYANIDVLIDNAHVRSSFESLVRLLPVTSWIFEGNVIPIILQHTIPTPLPEMAASDGPGGQAEREAMGKTPEAVMKSYVSIYCLVFSLLVVALLLTAIIFM